MQIYRVFVPLHDKPIIPKVLDSLAAAAPVIENTSEGWIFQTSNPMFTTAAFNIGMYQPVTDRQIVD